MGYIIKTVNEYVGDDVSVCEYQDLLGDAWKSLHEARKFKLEEE